MAGTKRISALPEMAADTLHEDDIIPVVDMSEPTVANKTKHVKAKNVLRAFDPVKARFATVAAFLADNNSVIGYAGSGARVTVADGDIIEAGGFRYSIRPTGASDNHVITAGGVKADVQPTDDGRYNVKAFGASATASDATNTAAMQAAATAGGSIFLDGLEITLTDSVSVSDDVYGPGKLLRDGNMLVVAEDKVTIDGVDFEGTATSGISVPVAVSAINKSKVTVQNCYLKNCRVWARNTQSTRLTDFRFQNNTVEADYSLVEHVTNQNDVVTVRGVDGVWITNNNFSITNVHRVLKIADTEAATTAGTAYRARNVFVTGNRIVGSTDSNKQVMDLFFYTSDIIVANNTIEVTGFYSVIENKTGSTQNYTQNTIISDNKISNDYAGIGLQGSYGATTSGYDVGYQNIVVANNTIESTAGSIGVLRYPIEVRFYDSVQITGNNVIAPVAFAETTGLSAIRVVSNAHAVVSGNVVSNGQIHFSSATTNQQAEPFAATMHSIVCNGNTVKNFGGSGVIGGILLDSLGSASSLRVAITGNYLKQNVDDAASAGCVGINNNTAIHTVAVQGNVAVMAAASEQRLRVLTSTVTALIEDGNSWNQVGRASATWDPASIAAGGVASTTLSVPGANLATDVVSRVSFSRSLVGLIMTAWVSATDTVTVQLYNPTSGSLDLASGTLAVEVTRKTAV